MCLLLTYINIYVNIEINEIRRCARKEKFRLINIIYTKSFDNSAKNLKRHRKELTILKEITEKITNHNTFEELRNNPVMTTIYKFKELRHQNSGFWSFNLEKNGGVIRLIVMPSENENEIIFVYVSYDHYNDFTPDKIRFYDE